MHHQDISRRSLLQAIAAAIATTALPSAVVEAGLQPRRTFLTAAEAADVEAVAAQIVPTDDTPGAREAGVLHFIDRGLATFLSHLADDYRKELAEFQATFRAAHPDAAAFAALDTDAQIAFLKTVDRTPFFEATRLLTLLGMFSLPSYGGNRDGAGWKLIGFDAQHMFQPPFGYYDRDYPGFAPEPPLSK